MSNIRILRWIGVGVALAVLALVPQELAAQGGTDGSESINRATVLRAEAQRLYASTDDWRQVMWLHERAAAVAPENDLERIVDYRVAAGLAYRFGNMEKAEMLLARAADVAGSVGSIRAEADLLLNAAFVALRMGDTPQADRLLHRAELLASSPMLAAEECDCIRTTVAAMSQHR